MTASAPPGGPRDLSPPRRRPPRRGRTAAHAGLCLVATMSAAPARGATYTFKDLYRYHQTFGGLQFSEVVNGAFRTQAVGAFDFGSGSTSQALLATSAASVTDLHPTNGTYRFSAALGTDGATQVGYANIPISVGIDHAMLWKGTAASFVDLSPQHFGGGGFINSRALAVRGTQQVGYAYSDDDHVRHPIVWSGTAASDVDLTPPGFGGGSANGTDGARQVGSADGHAMLWAGTAASYVDLHDPARFASSAAYGLSGGQQVGQGQTADGRLHALAWAGTPGSTVDLSPTGLPGIVDSVAVSTNGAVQAGYGTFGAADGPTHALAWAGTGDSAVDLTALVPATFAPVGQALDVDALGNVYGTAFATADGLHLVEWVRQVPEPGALAPVLLAGAAAGRPRRRRPTR